MAFRAAGNEIFVNAANRTGLSALEGTPLADVSQLPPFLVEIHVFQNAMASQAFVSGMEAAGVGNNMVYDRNPGTLNSNRCVLVGRLDELRPAGRTVEEAVPVHVHQPMKEDGAAIKRGLDETIRQRERDCAEQAKDCAPIREAFGGAVSNETWGRGWYRCTLQDGLHLTFMWPSTGGPYDLCLSCNEAVEGVLDVGAAIQAEAEARGISYDMDDREFRKTGVPASELLEWTARMAAAEKACLEIRMAAYRADFVSKTKMTAARKRFLKGGAEHGISAFVNRGSNKARAGGEEIGATEINILEKMGWIERSGRGFKVAAEGLEAASRFQPPSGGKGFKTDV